ncbi:MAG: helix-turn-helix domain-containing protein [Polaromonas sp.]|uniref:MerR family transcriptional regulator n=1 Tax=Polaromonas sp. TaxID=1869339 RepID=UPI00248730DE|nr:helix-turn-helix domain-containing protein [Polaromonas sp.]MDI1237212.1 helix-turn-helix domain-containing protein [Polaromonas sp.]MDO8370387.1 helix-turn-helix domain-containing protein [Polaromonas sp.]MDO8755812.1 helix-turn-helix domain-containing protein [Polaromonas sp.]
MNNLQNSGQLNIGALAQRTGFNVSAIRYYEEVGLIPEAMCRPNGHRVYSPDVQEVLTLVKHCRDFGFSIEETRTMVSLSTSNDRDCAETREIAQTHLNTVRFKLAKLQNLERSLSKFVQACTDQCVGGPAPKCSILKGLSVADSKLATSGRCCG